MISVPPRLRTDLDVRPQPSTDGPAYVIKDPASGQFYRLREPEYFIAQQFNGETPLEVVRERAEARFGANLGPDTLAAFTRTLIDSRLLETPNAPRKERARRGGMIRGNPLYLRFKLWDPDRALERLLPRLGFLFTPWFLAASGALILLAVATTIQNQDELAVELQWFARLASIPFAFMVVFALVSVHELAHGLTCKRFGGQVHEMGFMLIYFQPALYCNVSDAWLFPERRQRLWVGFSGPYVELTLWAVATTVWRLTDPASALHGFALIVVGCSGFKTLLNFNPLLKFDGYYLLSDFLEVPNLRSKSFAYLRSLARRPLHLPVERTPEVTLRERRIYLSYGLAAMAFSYCLLVWAIVIAGDYFIDNRGPIASVFACALVGFKVRRRIGYLFVKKPGKEKDHDDRSQAKGGRAWSLYALASGAALMILFLAPLELRIVGPFNVLPEENADIRAPLEEIVEDIFVDEGQTVKVGDPIAQLNDRPLRAELDRTGAEIEEAQAILAKLLAGPTSAEVDVARAGVTKAKDTQMYAGRRVDKVSILFRQGLVSQKEMEDAQELAASAENTRTEAVSRLNLLLRGTRPEEIAATNAKIEQLESQRHYLTEQMELMRVISPVAGIVATPTRQLKELRRQVVKKGDLIVKIFDMSTVKAQIFVSERELAGIKVGRRVELRARAYPDTTFHGVVIAIATSAQGGTAASSEPGVFSSGISSNKSVIVTTRIDNRSLLLKPEMTGQSKIFCGSRSIADLIWRRLALTFRLALWSWW